MNVSLYQAAAAMNAHERWQELITENLGSSSVPGARKNYISFAEVEAGLPAALNGGGFGRFRLPAAVASTSFIQGQLRPTGNKLDFALEGTGFFEVQLPDGQHAYTRDGEFRLNAQGQLTNKQGYLVLSNGGPVQFDPNNALPITVGPDGSITQGTESRGKLHIVEFKEPGKLSSAGPGCFVNQQPDMLAEDARETAVRQGYLEGANTSATIEMSELINAMRMFEANQRVLSMQDDRLGKVITELGHA